MKIAEIRVNNIPPVARFEAADLAEVVVIAGPNGVGKTRLINQLISNLQQSVPNAQTTLTIEATCDEERQAWGANTISDPLRVGRDRQIHRLEVVVVRRVEVVGGGREERSAL